jgi:alpha-ketoglutarate-dependent taurine dioxygenase
MNAPPRVNAASELDDRVEMWLLEQGAPPLFVEARPGAFAGLADAQQWVSENRATLDRLVLENGAVVLRGFPVESAEDFNAFITRFPLYERGYAGGGSPRSKVAGEVMEASRYDAHMKLCLHQEMAYTRDYPPRIAFFCRKPAEKGGETLIGHMRAFTDRLPESLRQRLETHGVTGVRNYMAPRERADNVVDRDGKTWDEAFGTTDRAAVERQCAEMDLKPIWRDGDRLAVLTTLPAFATHPVTGERYYRNIIHTDRFDPMTGDVRKARDDDPLATGYRFGDGTSISDDETRMLHAELRAIERRWDWQAGDMLLIDNLQVAHGRNPYVGERETLVALLA